ncbi:MAG: hypothetical protein CMJ84_17125 [Planctomycetes bacterium]|nr:hypothetical protein [Planctomycetota bacterium]
MCAGGGILLGALVGSTVWWTERTDRSASIARPRGEVPGRVSDGPAPAPASDSREAIGGARADGASAGSARAGAGPRVPAGRNRRRLAPRARILDRAAAGESDIPDPKDPDAAVLREFHGNGAPWVECPQKDGKRHGLARAWFPNGVLCSKQSYREGKLHGPARYWHPDGAEAASGAFTDGEKTGRWVEYGPDGGLRSEAEFSRGLRHGVCVYWDDEGNVVQSLSGTYEHGERAAGL